MAGRAPAAAPESAASRKTRTRESARASFFRRANSPAQKPDYDRRGAIDDKHREEEPRHISSPRIRRRNVGRRDDEQRHRHRRNDLDVISIAYEHPHDRADDDGRE